jgi:hypothetical protein
MNSLTGSNLLGADRPIAPDHQPVHNGCGVGRPRLVVQ